MNFAQRSPKVAVDAANPEPYRVLSRLFLTTSTGAIQLWQHDQHQWTREEGLADEGRRVEGLLSTRRQEPSSAGRGSAA